MSEPVYVNISNASKTRCFVIEWGYGGLSFQPYHIDVDQFSHAAERGSP